MNFRDKLGHSLRRRHREPDLPQRATLRGVIFWVVVGAVSLLVQVYLPVYAPLASQLELPLIVTLYLAFLVRDPVPALLYGALMGVSQDALLTQPVGLFGIVKTLAAYSAASASSRLDVEHPAPRCVLICFFFLFHQFFYWVLREALLGLDVQFPILLTLAAAMLNGAAGVLIFLLLDRLVRVV